MSFSKTFIVSILANSLNISRDICAARKNLFSSNFICTIFKYNNISVKTTLYKTTTGT